MAKRTRLAKARLVGRLLDNATRQVGQWWPVADVLGPPALSTARLLALELAHDGELQQRGLTCAEFRGALWISRSPRVAFVDVLTAAGYSRAEIADCSSLDVVKEAG